MVPATRFADLRNVQKKYSLDNIRFLTMGTEARHSHADGLWHLILKDTQTGQVRQRTCNFLFSCQGVLTIPNDPHFDTARFAGKVFHSAEWDKNVDLRDKNVVVVGNGCTAAQVIPNIVDHTRSVIQICRSTQCILPKAEVPG
jgi:cation diffusion facilitator CzcD-associated flavoprotein CzcO